MINIFSKIFYFLFLLLPIFLITGPAIPDLIITFSLIFLIILVSYKRKYYIFSNKLFLISIIFWLLIILISFFSYYKQASFQDSIIFIRILLIPIIGYYFFFYWYPKYKDCNLYNFFDSMFCISWYIISICQLWFRVRF